MSSGITRDEWLSALESAGIDERDDQDAITPTELADLLGIDRQAAARRLRKMVKLGKATQTRKRVAVSDGRVQSLPAYRLVAAIPVNGKPGMRRAVRSTSVFSAKKRR
jgi:hypothetical protein